MDILLSNGLGDEKHIRINFKCLFKELLVRNLRAHVDCFDHLIAFEPVVAGKALAVHDGIYTDGMRVSSGGSTDHDDFSAEMLADVFISILHAHGLLFDRLNMDTLIVNAVDYGTVDDIEGEFLIEGFCDSDIGFFNAHLAH